MNNIFNHFYINRISKYLCLLLLSVSAILMFSGCGDSKKLVLTTGFQDEEIFRINSDSCYANEALIYLVNTKNQYRYLYGDDFFNDEANSKEVNESVNQAVFSKLTRVKVMNILAQNYLITLDDSDLELIDKAAKEYFLSLTDEDKKVLGIESYEVIADIYKEYRIAEKVYEFIVKDINPEISDDEARTMIVKEIIFNTSGLDSKEISQRKKDAMKALTALEDGETFESVAALYSDSEQCNKSYTKMSIDPKIKDEAFNLSKDELSGIMEGEDSLYIFYCVDPFSRDETDTTKELIINEKRLQAFENVYSKFVIDIRFYSNEDVMNQVTNVDISKTSTRSLFDVYYKYFK